MLPSAEDISAYTRANLQRSETFACTLQHPTYLEKNRNGDEITLYRNGKYWILFYARKTCTIGVHTAEKETSGSTS